MTNYERIKQMNINEMAEFLERYKSGVQPSITLKDRTPLINEHKKWLLCENDIPTLKELNSKSIM